jgi:hypothetical protein
MTDVSAFCAYHPHAVQILPLHSVKDHNANGRKAAGKPYLHPIPDMNDASRRSCPAASAVAQQPREPPPSERGALACTALSRRKSAAVALDTNDAPHRSVGGGGERNRTDDLLLAKQALSQLSYTPSASGEARSRRRRLP